MTTLRAFKLLEFKVMDLEKQEEEDDEDYEYEKIALDLGYVKYHSNLYGTQGSTYYKLIPHKK